jgi:hypothetical protein
MRRLIFGIEQRGILKYCIFFGWHGYLPTREETALDMLVEGFNVLGVHIQFWMPLAVVVAAVAIGISRRIGGSR